jgi:hypothetical protein
MLPLHANPSHREDTGAPYSGDRRGGKSQLRDRDRSNTLPNLRIPAKNTRGQASARASQSASCWANNYHAFVIPILVTELLHV